jgi:hypothetical protein
VILVNSTGKQAITYTMLLLELLVKMAILAKFVPKREIY